MTITDKYTVAKLSDARAAVAQSIETMFADGYARLRIDARRDADVVTIWATFMKEAAE